jgi:hypothetical protein
MPISYRHFCFACPFRREYTKELRSSFEDMLLTAQITLRRTAREECGTNWLWPILRQRASIKMRDTAMMAEFCTLPRIYHVPS